MKMTPSLAGSYSGSVGGLTASHNKGGAYFRRRSVPVDPQSTYQARVRDSFANLSQAWNVTLTAIQRAEWDTYAQNTTVIDSLGQSIQLSGINWYIGNNTPRVQSGALFTAFGAPFAATARVDSAPVVFERGIAPVIASAGGGGAFGADTFNVNWTTAIADTVIFIFLGPPVNPAITFFKGPYLMVAGDGTGTVTNLDVTLTDTTAYTDRYGLPATGQRTFGYIRRSHNLDGARLSSRVPFSFIWETPA
jgi:hypothetical protein